MRCTSLGSYVVLTFLGRASPVSGSVLPLGSGPIQPPLAHLARNSESVRRYFPGPQLRKQYPPQCVLVGTYPPPALVRSVAKGSTRNGPTLPLPAMASKVAGSAKKGSESPVVLLCTCLWP